MKKRKKKPSSEGKWQILGISLFAVIMCAGCVLGYCFPFLRPTTSTLEKRELTKFPQFAWNSFLEGNYTSDVSLWYADTYPFREDLITANNDLQLAYGIRTDTISSIGGGDDIPDIPMIVPTSQEAGSSASAENPSASSEPSSSVVADNSTEAVQPTSQAETPNGAEIAQMNPQEAGQVNIKDLKGYAVYGFNLNAANIYAQNVANVANALAGTTTVHEMLIPDNSAIMLDEETKTAWKLSDETRVIAYYHAMTASLSTLVNHIDIYDTLMEHNDEYLYFYTDHHWTQLGAYYAYRQWAAAVGETPHELSEYNQIVMTDFLGSYYSTNGYSQLQGNPDTIYAYIPLTVNEISFFDSDLQVTRTGPIVRDLSSALPTQKYLSFIYGDNSYSEVNNPTVKNGKTCIVVKESFGNTFVPFLVDHYEKVIVIDYRSYKESVVELARTENASDIVFINNLEAISDTTVMNVLGNICR